MSQTVSRYRPPNAVTIQASKAATPMFSHFAAARVQLDSRALAESGSGAPQ
jgi:hypothetical protein